VQVVSILASGAQLPFEVISVKLDLPELQVRSPDGGVLKMAENLAHHLCTIRLQGDPEEISREKCRIAAKEVRCIGMHGALRNRFG